MPWGLLLNRYVIGAIAMAAIAAAFLVWLEKHDDEIEARLLAKINQAAEELAEDAVKAREPAFLPGAAQRLRERFCRDCETDVSRR